jgi:SAM-dependent methyltransferase
MRELGPDSIEMREHLYTLIDWSGVKAVLDVGCGDGFDLAEIAKLVAATDVTFVGLDASAEKVEAARKRFKGDSRFSVLEADIDKPLHFPDDYFDVVICMNALECLRDRQALLKEIHRVLVDNGQILITHFDWDSQLINATNKSLARKIVHAFCDWKQPWMNECDGWMGRRLHGAISTTGLFDGEVKTYVLTNTKFEATYYGFRRIEDFGVMAVRDVIPVADYRELLREVQQLANRGEYFYSITNFAYIGRKR